MKTERDRPVASLIESRKSKSFCFPFKVILRQLHSEQQLTEQNSKMQRKYSVTSYSYFLIECASNSIMLMKCSVVNLLFLMQGTSFVFYDFSGMHGLFSLIMLFSETMFCLHLGEVDEQPAIIWQLCYIWHQ